MRLTHTIIEVVALAACTWLVIIPNAQAQKTKLAVLPTQFDETSRGQVPSLFDDYLLTAVQNIGKDYEVIGQEDISAMLGFEQQKDLLDCSDTSCMADIGGALGVDSLVVVKIARLGEDWVATGKLINIKETRVESRVNKIVNGSVKNLLQAVPGLVAELFGQAPPPIPATTAPAGTTTAPQPAQPPPAAPPSAPKKRQMPNPSKGWGLRVGGSIMLIGGAVAGGIAGLMLTFTSAQLRGEPVGYFGSDIDPLGIILGVYGMIGLVIALVVEGIGAKLYVMGAAKAKFGTDQATGTPALYWLGWLLAAGTATWPVITAFDGLDPEINAGIGWAIGLSCLLVFMIPGFGEGDAHETAALNILPTIRYARTGPEELTPTYGLALTF